VTKRKGVWRQSEVIRLVELIQLGLTESDCAEDLGRPIRAVRLKIAQIKEWGEE